MINSTKGNTLLVTLLMTSLMGLLIMSMLGQIHLENKLINQIRTRQVLFNAVDSVLNDLAKKVEKLPMTGQQTISGFAFDYQIIALGEIPCLIIRSENKVFQSFHYQIILHHTLKETIKARIALPSNSKKQCHSKKIQIPKGIQYILHEV